MKISAFDAISQGRAVWGGVGLGLGRGRGWNIGALFRVQQCSTWYVGCYDLAGVCRTIILFLLILI